ncbi:hypothetical protein B5P44_01650 [Mycobacterium sp. CBMA 213]|nr:hypothetical protein [Mycolicibacterium sp. CBMA 335]MUM03494.1 hypothetical protein [Mycolicibacterium sp. CBMA 213]
MDRESATGATKVVDIEWIEESLHRVRVRVPADFDAEHCDLSNDLATLDGDGFVGLERSVTFLRHVADDGKDYEFFTPPTVA